MNGYRGERDEKSDGISRVAISDRHREAVRRGLDRKDGRGEGTMTMISWPD